MRKFLSFLLILICILVLKMYGQYLYDIHIYKGVIMKFKPLHDRVLIEVLDSSEKTAGGIIIPDTAQEKPQEGKVVAVGGGAKTEDGKIIPMMLRLVIKFYLVNGQELKSKLMVKNTA